MPHYSNYGGTRFSAQPADELTGTFNALNETTNFRPAKGESVSIVHPTFRTGLINPDSMRPIDELTSSFIEKAQLMRHAPKDSEYRPQSSIDVVTGKPDSTSIATEIGLQITGEGPDQWIQYNTNDGAVEGKLGGKSDSGGTSFITSAIEAPAEMTSFGESLNPVAELGGTAGPGATSFLTGQFEMPSDNVGNPYSAPID